MLYFTDGSILQSGQEDGKYWYWFVIERTENRPAEDTEARKQQSAQQAQIDALGAQLATLSLLGG